VRTDLIPYPADILVIGAFAEDRFYFVLAGGFEQLFLIAYYTIPRTIREL
jgi:hypothetical protein